LRFFLDHDVPTEVASVLREEGHSVTELRQVLPTDSSDAQVFDYAREPEMFLISCNRDDFLGLAASDTNPGLIILKRRRTRHAECAHLLRLLSRAGEQGLPGNINLA
jgi:predicted nuclease of predicted toxin-antitoxin system